MSLNASLQISASGLTAERLRLDVISNNLANVNTTRTPGGGPFRRSEVVISERAGRGGFASALTAARGGFGNRQATGAGVEVTEIRPDMTRPMKVVHDPGHPDADAKGNVQMPNVEPVTEMVDMIAVSRAYEAGVTAMTAAKQMQTRALELGRA